MRNLGERKEETLSRWNELVTAAIRNIDTIATAFLDRVHTLEPYQSGLVSREELHTTARESVRLILEAVIAGVTTSALSVLPTELGQRRARQGVPAEDLADAVRLDFAVVWAALLEHAGDDDAMVLALHVDSLWAVVDEYARVVLQSCLEEKAALAEQRRDQQQAYLAELFGPSGQLPSTIDQVARALNVDAGAAFRVVAVDLETSAQLHRAASSLTAMGEQFFVLTQTGLVAAIWPAPRTPYRGDEPQLRHVAGVTGGYIPEVGGLARVAAAVRCAADIFRTVRPGEHGLVTVDQAWPRLTKGRLDEQIGFTGHVLQGLTQLLPEERERVIETVRAYLATGSVAKTSAMLYCHRNTVLNRLGKFEKATNLDVTVPEQASLALLALA